MRSSASTHTKKALFSYLAKISNGELRSDSPQQSAFKLLNLLFAYKRSQYKLNLRWNREACHHLALITLQELASKKKTDPVLNGIYDAIVIIYGENKEAVAQLLETCEVRIDEISASQTKKATTPRELNAVLKRAKHYYSRDPSLMPGDIIEKLKSDEGLYGINSYDPELEKFFYDENGKKYPREKTISAASVRNFISKLRKNNLANSCTKRNAV